MRYRCLLLIVVLLALLGARPATASAIYFAEAEATVRFVGLDHAGGGVGVSVFPDAFRDFEFSDYSGDAFASSSTHVAVFGDLIEFGSFSDGEATNGDASSGSSIVGGFWIDNIDSVFDATGFFAVSGSIGANTGVFDSLGVATAEASFDSAFVSSSTAAGFDRAVEDFPLFGATLTVAAGSAEFFGVHLSTSGSASAIPASVTEPVATGILAMGLFVAGLVKRR
jgi:hypothetical protein